jgi:hypothetical protein
MDCSAYNVANNTGADILYANFNQDYRYKIFDLRAVMPIVN